MKILFAPSDNNLTSGAFRSMATLNRILNQEHGIETLVVLPNPGEGYKLLEEFGVKYTYIDTTSWIVKSDRSLSDEENQKFINNHYHNMDAIEKFKKLMIDEKIDILHVNTSYNYIAAMAAHMCKIPVVWHLREFLEEDQKRRYYDKAFAHSLLRRSDKVIAISKALYTKYLPIVGEDRLQVVYNGIDTDCYYNPKKEIFKKGSKEYSFIITGAVNYSKGQDLLVHACGLLYKKGITNFKLKIVGFYDERYEGIIKNVAAKYGIEDKVELLGRREDVHELLKESDICFMCSKFEAFGRVTVEAMLGGNLVIGSNSGGTVEIIEDGKTGLLFEQGNKEDLCSKIEYALSHQDEMKQIAARGREEMKTKFSARRNASEIVDIYNEILAKEKDNSPLVMGVVVTYNRLEMLKKCIAALQNQTYKNFKILLVDNASTDDTPKYCQSLEDDRIIYQNTNHNLGGAGGFNFGMKYAYFYGADWVWIMDDDVVPEKNALEELVKASESIKKEKNAYFASCVYGPSGKPMNTPGVDPAAKNGYPFWFNHLDKGMVRLNAATFVSLLINSKAIEKCGLPYKDFFIWGDDTEYTKRLYRNFGSAYIVGKSKVIHLRENENSLGILGEDNPNRIKMYFYFIRNTLVYTNEYAGEKALKQKLELFEDYITQLKEGKDPLRKEKIEVIRKGIKGFYDFNFKKFANRFDVLLEEHTLLKEQSESYVVNNKTIVPKKSFKEKIKRILYGSNFKSFHWYLGKIFTWPLRFAYHLAGKILRPKKFKKVKLFQL